jgi:prepilin-type N-terminal cleavage/methylation domain-containing protein
LKRSIFKCGIIGAFRKADKSKKKGVTLAEISVALAVVAIISVSVVTFTTLLSARSTTSAAKLNAVDDINLCESIVDMWVDQVLDCGGEITVADNTLSTSIDGESHTLGFADGNIVYSLPEGSSQVVLSVVTDLELSELSLTADKIYFCKVKYDIPMDKDVSVSYEYVFSVSPRTGDVVGGAQ